MKTYIKILLLWIGLSGIGCSSSDGVAQLDFEQLDALIVDCKTDIESAVEGGNIGEYVVGSKAIFDSAIKDAEYVKQGADRQSAIENYIVKLGVARKVFHDSKVAMACPYFDGTAYIDCGPAAQLIGSIYTVEIWVKMSGSSGAGAGILGAEGTNGSSWDGFMLRRAEGIDKALDFCVVNGMWSSCLTPANSFSFDRWTHIACSFDGHNAKIYLDGVESGAMTVAEYITTCWGNLFVGDMAYFRGRCMVGNAYDFRIWNTVRSAEQISENMNSILVGDEDGLVANWPLNVKSGTTLTDITGKHSANLHNITWADLDRITE